MPMQLRSWVFFPEDLDMFNFKSPIEFKSTAYVWL